MPWLSLRGDPRALGLPRGRRRGRARDREGRRAASRALPRRGLPARRARDDRVGAARLVAMFGRVKTGPGARRGAALGRPGPALARQRQHARRPADARDSTGSSRASCAAASNSTSSKSRPRSTAMPSERPITVYLNEREIATTQATPRDLEDLAAGFLVSEGCSWTVTRSCRWTPTRSAAWSGSPDRGGRRRHRRETRYVTSGCGKRSDVRERRSRARARPDRPPTCASAPRRSTS